MNFENFNFENFENVVQQIVEGGFHSEAAREFREGLRAACPELTQEQADLLLPWAEALAAHLRQVAAPKVAAPKVAAPAPAPKRPTAKELENFFFV
jgi:hypothetical protein